MPRIEAVTGPRAAFHSDVSGISSERLVERGAGAGAAGVGLAAWTEAAGPGGGPAWYGRWAARGGVRGWGG
jgi:hypothetical protein